MDEVEIHGNIEDSRCVGEDEVFDTASTKGNGENEKNVKTEKNGDMDEEEEEIVDKSHSNVSDSSGSSDNDDDDNDSSDSDVSLISNFSGKDWDPNAEPISWVQSRMMAGDDPLPILRELLPSGVELPNDFYNGEPMRVWKIIYSIVSQPPPRQKLDHVNTLDDVVHLISSSSKIIVLTGAGVSVSCGIPDFRSRDGVYARLAVDFPNLPDPQAMFDISFFTRDPRPFFKFAKEIYPGQFQPSICHKFIKLMEDENKLLRNYTQNIDTLEQVVGLKNVIQCHGSFATATCTECSHNVDCETIRPQIFNQEIPYCDKCEGGAESIRELRNDMNFEETKNESDGAKTDDSEQATSSEKQRRRGVLKPDIVFFGQSLGSTFHDTIAEDKDQADLLIMIGSSLKVRPVALIPSAVKSKIPQILINREPLSHLTPDVELLGNCDAISTHLMQRLGWSPSSTAMSGDGDSTTQNAPDVTSVFHPPNRYLFEGAELQPHCESNSSSSSSGEPDDPSPPSERNLDNNVSRMSCGEDTERNGCCSPKT